MRVLLSAVMIVIAMFAVTASSASGRTLIVTLPIADPMGEIDFVCTRPTASGYDAVTLEFERRAFEEPTCRRDYTTLSLEDGPVLFCVDGRSGVWRYPGAEAEDCMAGFSPVVVTGDGSVTVHTPKRGAAIVYSPGYAGGPIALVCEWQL